MHHVGFNTLIYSWCRTWMRWVLFTRRRWLYECFCVVWNFSRCRCEAKHFENSHQKTQNQKCMLVYTSQCCVCCVCPSVYCVQVGPTLCTYLYMFRWWPPNHLHADGQTDTQVCQKLLVAIRNFAKAPERAVCKYKNQSGDYNFREVLQFVGLQMEQTCRLFTIPARPVTGSVPGVNKDQIGEQRTTRRRQLYQGSTFFCSYLSFHPPYGEVPRSGMLRPSVCSSVWLWLHFRHACHLVVFIITVIISSPSLSSR
jgi:hypothetical protein